MQFNYYRLPEHYSIKVEGVLNDAGGGHPGPQDILLRGQVVWILYAHHVIQKTEARLGNLSSNRRIIE